MAEWSELRRGPRTTTDRSGRATAILMAILTLLGATLWLAHSWTDTETSEALPRVTKPLPEHESTATEEPLGHVGKPVLPDAARTNAPVTQVPPTPGAGATAAAPAEPDRETMRGGRRGQVNLYRDGQLTTSHLNGTIDVKASGGDWATFPLVQGRFELIFHRQPSGSFATADQELSLEGDLERVRFKVAAPRADGTAPLLHYFLKTGAPRRDAERGGSAHRSNRRREPRRCKARSPHPASTQSDPCSSRSRDPLRLANSRHLLRASLRAWRR